MKTKQFQEANQRAWDKFHSENGHIIRKRKYGKNTLLGYPKVELWDWLDNLLESGVTKAEMCDAPHLMEREFGLSFQKAERVWDSWYREASRIQSNAYYKIFRRKSSSCL